ncbi:hypothetical protein U8V72_11340 [Priestia filamentosa]|uniref:hypothetical protein n=1 Tax=Priestia filamentosa TaxID=1402861 RepID=UPI003978AC26
MKQKLKSSTKKSYHFMKKHIKSLYKFARRNQRELKLIATPFASVTFVAFAFTGFLMNNVLNPYFVGFSRFMVGVMVTFLLLYCIWDLAKQILFTPFRRIVEREKENA